MPKKRQRAKEVEVTFEEMKGRKLKIKPVDVSEWFKPGSTMYVRELSAKEAAEFAKKSKSGGKDADEEDNWSIFASCVCHKNGAALFPNGEVPNRQDIAAGLFQTIFLEAAKLNGLAEDDAAKN